MEPVEQEHLAKVILSIIGPHGFALAGSGAIREHGLINRPTEDLDMFAKELSPEEFNNTLNDLAKGLASAGYSLVSIRQSNAFFQGVAIGANASFQVDLGLDYREYPPTVLSVGPVLDIKDAVANKVCAAFSRGEPRDFLDLDSIRESRKFTDHELLTLAANNDTGFTPEYLAMSLMSIESVEPEQVEPYQVNAVELEAIKNRLIAWANEIINSEKAVPSSEGTCDR